MSVYNLSTVGIEFEFYSNFDKKKTAEQLENLLGKKIECFDESHSDFSPTAETFKLEADFSGGADLLELVTGPLRYKDAVSVINDVCNWIKSNGYTTERSSIHLNISFIPALVNNNKNFVRDLDPLKFILNFDEKAVYKDWPNRENSTYAKSIKYITPNKKNFILNKTQVSKNDFNFPNTKYYGVNFLKLEKNYLEFRYLGGENWHNKVELILKTLKHFIKSLHQSCMQTEFTVENINDLEKILRENKPYFDLYNDHTSIKTNFPDLEFTVDLKKSAKTISVYWDSIKDRVVDLMLKTGLKSGKINYDTNISKIQIKDVELEYAHAVEGLEFFNSKLNGEFTKCVFYNCEINAGDLSYCDIFKKTEIKNSKIKSCYVAKTSVLKNCYFFGRDGVLRGSMIGGIYREGLIDDENADVKKSTEVVDKEKVNKKDDSHLIKQKNS